MSEIQMYLEPEDVNILLNWLNEDEEIAFFKSIGPKQWCAVNKVESLEVINVLWHTRYQNLPLFKGVNEKKEIIGDPWSGWTEVITSPTGPYFGNCPGIIHLGILVNRYILNENKEQVDVILISGFNWIGNYFRSIGNPALKETENWWKTLRKKVTKISKKFSLEGNWSVYAFPDALKSIETGKKILNVPYANDTYEK